MWIEQGFYLHVYIRANTMNMYVLRCKVKESNETATSCTTMTRMCATQQQHNSQALVRQTTEEVSGMQKANTSVHTILCVNWTDCIYLLWCISFHCLPRRASCSLQSSCLDRYIFSFIPSRSSIRTYIYDRSSLVTLHWRTTQSMCTGDDEVYMIDTYGVLLTLFQVDDVVLV